MTHDGPAPGWIPSRLSTGAGGVRCEWIDAAGIRITEPFFEMTLARCRHEGRARAWSTLEHLREQAERAPHISPAFIFHVSRCGSPLFSQLLGLDERAVVLSEAPLLDEILRSDRPDREPLFAAALRLLGRRRSVGEARLFVKTDCWHMFYAPLIRRLYPGAPFILLYRSPAAVLGSQKKAHASHMVPGLIPRAPFQIEYAPARTSLDQYGARVLERHYTAMLEVAAHDRNSLLVSYDEGFPAAFLRAADWLSLAFDKDHLRRVRERCGYHGKRPHDTFGGDAMPPLDGVDLSALQSLFHDLEARRGQAHCVSGPARHTVPR
jgi:hypothetical protein